MQASLGTPLPERDAPFITSLLTSNKSPSKQQTSTALDSFMKFDRKYAAKTVGRADAANADTDLETDMEESEMTSAPVVSASRSASPTKIASELEEKLAPGSRRSSVARRASSSSQGGGRLKWVFKKY